MRFKLFGFPVLVEPMFFFLVIFLGAQRQRVDLVVIWMAVIFVSILVHELGHAFVGRRLGLSPAIRLHGMGGQTEWIVMRRITRMQGIGISFAGPCAGFMLAFLVFQAQPFFLSEAADWRLSVVYQDLLWVNIGWGLINLLPILPLDGGHIMQSSLHAYLNRNDDYWPYVISTGVSALGAGLGLLMGSLWTAIIAGYFSYSSFQVVRKLRRTPFRRTRRPDETGPGPGASDTPIR